MDEQASEAVRTNHDGRWWPVTAALIGAVFTGLGALYFALVENAAKGLFAEIWRASPAWLFMVMPAGLGVILYLRDHYFRGTDGTGIPQTIAALKMGPGAPRDDLLSMRVAAGKLILTTLGIGSSLSIGREGPSVQLGACFMHLVGRWTRFPAHLIQRGLVLGGGAAGIAAAFNAPIAGIVFACEEIGRSFEKENLGTLVRTVAVACIVCVMVLGNYYFYGRLNEGRAVPLEFATPGPWLTATLIGIVGGLLGGGFSALLLGIMPAVSRVIRARFWVIALTFGVASAGLAWLSDGHTLGSGYEQARALVVQGSPHYLDTLPSGERERLVALADDLGPAYPVLRATASMLVLLTGIPGGLFDPSFSVGAGLGKLCAPFLAWTGISTQAVVLLFIVSYFSGVVQSPMTSFIILIEMTGAIEFTLPLAISAILAYEASRRVCPTALYEALAENFLRATARPAPRPRRLESGAGRT
jgi:H+/Cl- antiporter ClcA